jgi:hypothetical protein
MRSTHGAHSRLALPGGGRTISNTAVGPTQTIVLRPSFAIASSRAMFVSRRTAVEKVSLACATIEPA